MIVHLPPHAIHLLADRRGQLALAGALGALGFVREHGERRLQPVREIAGLGQRAAHAPLAMRRAAR